MPDGSALQPHRPGLRAGLRAAARPALVLVAVFVLGGCAVAASPTLPAPTRTPDVSAASSPSIPAPSPSTGPTAGPSASLPSQTDTAWGRIWDDLPAAFPQHPGARAGSVAREPVSAEYTVEADPVTVMAALRTALEAAGYSTVSLSGPLEDGSRTLESVGAATGCRVRTTVSPLGGLTYVAVLFGAACPFR